VILEGKAAPCSRGGVVVGGENVWWRGCGDIFPLETRFVSIYSTKILKKSFLRGQLLDK
jgi:hypothetical protein